MKRQCCCFHILKFTYNSFSRLLRLGRTWLLITSRADAVANREEDTSSKYASKFFEACTKRRHLSEDSCAETWNWIQFPVTGNFLIEADRFHDRGPLGVWKKEPMKAIPHTGQCVLERSTCFGRQNFFSSKGFSQHAIFWSDTKRYRYGGASSTAQTFAVGSNRGDLQRLV